MRVAITGAGGFIGRKVVELALLRTDISSITITDRSLRAFQPDPRLRLIAGDVADPIIQDATIDDADVVIHLAAVLGGAAESDPAASRRINLDATLNLIDRAKRRRFILASTIAVYGRPPALIDDDTPCAPRLVYAMHKRMAEVALETAVHRGDADGFALRVPGVVPRPGQTAGLKSAFLSDLFNSMRENRQVTVPVARDGRTLIASVDVVAGAMLHAAMLTCDAPGTKTSFPLPALSPRFEELESALMQRYPTAPSVDYRPDPEMMEGFGMFGDLVATEAARLGFPSDRDLNELIARAS